MTELHQGRIVLSPKPSPFYNLVPRVVPRAFPLENGRSRKSTWHRLVTCPLMHSKILDVIELRKMYSLWGIGTFTQISSAQSPPDNHSVAAHQFSRKKKAKLRVTKEKSKIYSNLSTDIFFLFFDNSFARKGGARYTRLIGFTIWTRYVPGTW